MSVGASDETWVAHKPTVSDAENPPATAPAAFSVPAGVPAPVTAATPAISTTSGAGGPVGSTTATDTATLTGGSSPTGTITFNLYGPSDTADCSGTPVDAEAIAGNGSYSTPTGYTPTATAPTGGPQATAGTPATTRSPPLPVTSRWSSARPPPPSVRTAAAAGPIGSSVNASTTLTGGFNPTGTITFTLYSQPDCTNPIATSPQGVNGDGNYTTVPFTLPAVGQYYWVAAYSGDSSNLAVVSGCNDAPVAVFRAVGPTHHDIRAATGRG